MLLAIDSGNTNVVFAVFSGDALKGSWRASTDVKRTADEYAVWLTQLMHLAGLGPSDIDDAVIATVVPETLFELKSLVRRYFRCDPLVIGGEGVTFGVTARIDRPEEVGVDRLVNAAAAHRRYGGPLIVIDFGTATTFDIVDGQGDYIGGVIAPGINLSIDALYRAAAQLPRIAVRRPASAIGRSTIGAMQSGVFWGYVGLIDGIVDRIVAQQEESMTVIATGGLATLFEQDCRSIQHVDADLTLWGLRYVHGLNRGAA